MGNTYSVPSRLIGTSLLVRVRAETLEGYVGSSHALSLPRLVGKQQHRIDYRHIIWSLVRKPGAFAAYRYHDDLFPTTTFRRAYDRLVSERSTRADHEYVRILQAFGQHRRVGSGNRVDLVAGGGQASHQRRST